MNLWNLRYEEPSRVYDSQLDEAAVSIACAIIEQAVIDWKELDYGKMNRCMGKCDLTYIYADEVEAFFKSKWFEYLLSLTIPQHTPEEFRKILKIPEPRRRKSRERTPN